jgi:hypothetical protein
MACIQHECDQVSFIIVTLPASARLLSHRASWMQLIRLAPIPYMKLTREAKVDYKLLLATNFFALAP